MIKVSKEMTNILTISVHLYAERLRLFFGGGWSWEFFRIERELHPKAYAQCTFGYRQVHLAVLGPVGVFPPKTFYKLRGWYSERCSAHVRRVVGSAMPVPSLSLRKSKDS